MEGSKIESGVQLFFRLNQRTYLNGLNPTVFPNGGPKSNEVIEIVGKPEVNKTSLLLDFIARCILPTDYYNNWKGSGAILILTDFHITVLNIIKVLNAHLKLHNVEQRHDAVQQALSNLTIFNCYNQDQLEITLHNLENVVLKNNNVSLVVWDNVAAQYWSSRFHCPEHLSLHKFSLQNFNLIHSLLRNLNVVILFVRHDPELQERQFSDKVDLRLTIKQPEPDTFEAIVNDFRRRTTFNVTYKEKDAIIIFL